MLNKVQLIGRLGQDTETRFMPNGDPVANFNLATSERWKDKATGEKKEQTEWHRIVLFRALAKVASDYLKKGHLVYIEGRLRTHKWQGKDGQDKYTTEIVASELIMLESKGNERNPPASSYAEGASSSNNESPPPSMPDYDKYSEEDIPF